EQSRAEQSRAEQSRAEQSRLSWLDILKGTGIILVVIGHIYHNSIIYNWLYSFHMPLFFIAAGWVYKEKSVLVDIKRRIQTIVIPYFSFGFIILIYWQVIERKFRDSDMSFIDSLIGLFSGAYDNLDFNVHLWFLPCFFVTVVIFNIIVNISSRKVAYIISALMSIVYIIIPMPGLPWGIDRMFKFIGFYAVGTFFAGELNGEAYKKMEVKIFAVVLLLINFFLAYFNLTTGIMWFITALIGVAGMMLFAWIINENRPLQYFGRISLIILCIHGSVYRIVVKVISIPFRMSTDAVRENILLSLFVVTVTMVICSIAYEIVMRIAPWMVGKKSTYANMY
ncbi:acyltransferase family protein, partial [Eubacterium sp. MSJ-13]|uniref:acyltransferase family protein n=1 Tax=Eubacterium sp. MSJ-13 TaxID=2841513 RepID=UPI001C124A02